MQSYQVKIPHFEGPFDLLLFFIERDELDIYDIPIAKITKDFLDYITVLDALNIDVASEFILMAATLMKIKSKMLIPRKEIDEHGNEVDPREELVQKLLEYKKYKAVIDEFSSMEELRHLRFSRNNGHEELRQIASKSLVDVELESLSLYKLFATFQNLLLKYEKDLSTPKHRIVNYTYTISGQQNYILSHLSMGQRIDFTVLFKPIKTRIEAIVTFIALLEMLNLQQIKITQGEGINNFWIEQHSSNGEEE